MQREILFVGRLRRGEKKEDLIGVLSRTVFVEEKKGHQCCVASVQSS